MYSTSTVHYTLVLRYLKVQYKFNILGQQETCKDQIIKIKSDKEKRKFNIILLTG